MDWPVVAYTHKIGAGLYEYDITDEEKALRDAEKNSLEIREYHMLGSKVRVVFKRSKRA